MQPRLHQPLFSKGVYSKHAATGDKLIELYNELLQNPELRPLMLVVMAYDCIWTQLYRPEDITEQHTAENAVANLKNLEQVIMDTIGPDAFLSDPRQLSFCEKFGNELK
jgi:hypothetical protein